MNPSHRSKLNIFTFLAVFAVAFFAFGTAVVKAAPPTVVITVSPGTVLSGTAATITWTTTDATSCTASGDWSGAKALNGSESTGILTSEKTYTLTCTGPEGTASAFTFVSVTANPAPTVTLTATPSSVTSGGSSTLSWTSTSATTCTASGDWSGSKTVGSGTEVQNNLTSNKSYTITCTGTGGSASATATVTVTANPPPTIVITASPGSVTSGSSATLTWTSTNATTCTASGDWSGAKAINGTESTGALTSGKTYNISCTGPGGTATAFTFVTVTANPVPTVTLVANPTSVVSNASSTLTWVSTNATTCTASGDWSGSKTLSGSEVQNNLTSNKSYTIVCTGLGGSATSTATVTVTANPVPTVTLVANPTSVVSNASSTLTWISTNATTCTASGDWSGTKAINGSEVQNNLTTNKSYTIVCTGLGGSATSTATVTVTANPAPTVTLVANPTSVAINASSTLTWVSTNATNCIASGDWSGTKALSGSEVQNNLTSNKSYTIVCTGLGGSATSTAAVTVVTSCPAPQITSPLTSTITLGQSFTYTVTASSTTAVVFAVNNLPAGLTFSTTTNTISGTPTSSGTFNIQLLATNACGGVDNRLLVLSVNTTGSSGANLGVSKTSNRTTANVGDEIIYTIVVTNTGPENATSVVLTDILPSGISFSTSTASIGSYSTTTGIWNIGNLNNGSSVTLTIQGTVRTGFQGQTITNTATVVATQTDPNTGNNTSSVNVSVNNPTQTCTINCGGGGGGSNPNSNLGVSKTSNRTTATVGDTVIYTITVHNAGPDIATAVTAVDNIPAGILFSSSTVSQGTYTSGNGMWFIGTLNVGSSTTLVIQGTVRNGFQGQVIVNNVNVYAAQTDPFPSNNTASVVINATGAIVIPPTSCYYLFDYLRKDFNNNPVEVRKLQVFLRDLEGFTNVQITGIYDDQTIVALDAFQARYASEILTPWGHTAPTSYTYILTKKKVNEIYCRMAFPVTPLQQQEINNYRAFLLGLQNAGIQFPSTGIQPIVVPAGTSTPAVLYNEVGISTTTPYVAGNATSTVGSRFTANIAYVGNIIAGWFDSLCNWINWLLLLVIAVISYFWYRERENNRKIEQINKDLLMK